MDLDMLKAFSKLYDCITKQRNMYLLVHTHVHAANTTLLCSLQRVVGFHVIKSCEGHRDGLTSLYQFVETPPAVVVCDFGCRMLETGLNWLPEYFKDTFFCHDDFHGNSRLCPPTFNLDLFADYAVFNSSVMEEVNSYIQPVKGLTVSGTTRVSVCL